jgi:hypothetical protein
VEAAARVREVSDPSGSWTERQPTLSKGPTTAISPNRAIRESFTSADDSPLGPNYPIAPNSLTQARPVPGRRPRIMRLKLPVMHL